MAEDHAFTEEDLKRAKYRFEKVDSNQIPRNPWAFVVFASKPYWWLAAGTILVSVLGQTLSSFLPYVFKQVIDTATTAVNAGMHNLDDVWFWGIVFVVTAAVMHLMWRLSGFGGVKWAIAMHATGNYAVFEYLSKHSHSYFSNRFAGALATKIAHVSDHSAELMMTWLWTAMPGLLGFIITVILASITNIWLGALFLLLVLLVVPINIYMVKYRKPHVVAYSDAKAATTGRLVDTVTNIFAVQHFARRNTELQAFEEYLSLRGEKDIRQTLIGEWLVTINATLALIFQTIIILTTLWLWSRGMVTLGDFVMILTLLLQLDETVTFIGHTMNRFVKSYGQVQEGLDTILVEHEVVDAPEAAPLKVRDGMIEFDRVSFKYNDEDVSTKVFDKFELCIPPHQKVGLVGESGAGKSTLVSLLLRQHDLTSGRIKIDGHDISQVTQESLREHIAVVPQEPMLFHRSIMENIRYGRLEATDKEVMEAAKMAQAHDFITATPKGYDTLVGERGVKLSGGQRQRVAIARAILKNAPILVLDEATSALDSESEVLIQKALHELMEGKTVIAVAHRLSTLREMDRIIVMDKGVVAQDGAHDELVKEEGIYKRLWSHQAGGFLQDE